MTLDELLDRLERSGGGRTPLHVIFGCSPSAVRQVRAGGRIPPSWLREAFDRLDVDLTPEAEEIFNLAGPWRGPSKWDAGQCD